MTFNRKSLNPWNECSVSLQTWAKYCGVVYFCLCHLDHTQPETTRPKKPPTQWQTMDNGDLFRLGEINCVQVWDFVYWNTEHNNSFIWQQLENNLCLKIRHRFIQGNRKCQTAIKIFSLAWLPLNTHRKCWQTLQRSEVVRTSLSQNTHWYRKTAGCVIKHASSRELSYKYIGIKLSVLKWLS